MLPSFGSVMISGIGMKLVPARRGAGHAERAPRGRARSAAARRRRWLVSTHRSPKRPSTWNGAGHEPVRRSSPALRDRSRRRAARRRASGARTRRARGTCVATCGSRYVGGTKPGGSSIVIGRPRVEGEAADELVLLRRLEDDLRLGPTRRDERPRDRPPREERLGLGLRAQRRSPASAPCRARRAATSRRRRAASARRPRRRRRRPRARRPAGATSARSAGRLRDPVRPREQRRAARERADARPRRTHAERRAEPRQRRATDASPRAARCQRARREQRDRRQRRERVVLEPRRRAGEEER